MQTEALKKELSGLRELFAQLEQWSIAAAQELQELLDDTIESGNPEPTGTRLLLDEHSKLMRTILGTPEKQERNDEQNETNKNSQKHTQTNRTQGQSLEPRFSSLQRAV